MMHQCLKLCAAAVGVSLLLALPGCGGQGEPGGPQPTDPTHIYRQVQDNLLIDAEVKGPPEGTVPKVYVGEANIFTQEKVNAFLAWSGDEIAEVTLDIGDDTKHQSVATCRSGARLANSFSLNNPPSSAFDYKSVESMERYIAYPLSRTQQDYEECSAHRSGRRITYLFEEPTELSFATAQETEGKVREALSTLGLEDLILNRTLYLSHDRMEEAGWILQGEEWAHQAKGGETATFPQWDDWSEAHDCYLFEFFCGVDNVPMSYHTLDNSTTIVPSTDIVVYYTRQGIVGLNIMWPWSACEVAETPERTLSATEALQRVQERLENTISSQMRTVERVELIYLCKQDGDRWLLRPVWEISVWQSGSNDYEQKYTYIRIDAITGEEY